MTRGDFQHHLGMLMRMRASLYLVAFLLTIHTAVELAGGIQSAPFIYQWLGLTWDRFSQGAFWQLWSYSLLHGNTLHLLTNVLGIILLGSRIEFICGARGWLRLCFLSVIGGGIIHLFVTFAQEDAPILIGFSAAVMAALLMLTTLSPESRMWPLPVSGRALGLGILIAEGFCTLIDPALGLPGLSRMGDWLAKQGAESWFNVAHGCHFGGGLAGWLYGRWLLRQRITIESLRRERIRREARDE